MHNVSRREALRFIPALGAAMMLPVPGQTATRPVSRHPDAELLRLGRQLARGMEHERAMQAAAERDPELGIWLDRAFEANCSTVCAIAACPAHTVEGLRVKAQGIAWCHFDEPEPIMGEGQTTSERLAGQVVHGLLTL